MPLNLYQSLNSVDQCLRTVVHIYEYQETMYQILSLAHVTIYVPTCVEHVPWAQELHPTSMYHKYAILGNNNVTVFMPHTSEGASICIVVQPKW